MCCKSNHLTNTPHLLQQRHKISSFHNDEMYINGFPFYPSQGQMTEAIKYLEKVVNIARNNFQSLDVIRACTMLGDIYNEKVSCVSLFLWKSLQSWKSLLTFCWLSHQSVWKMAAIAGCGTDTGKGRTRNSSFLLIWGGTPHISDHCHSVFKVTECREQGKDLNTKALCDNY